MDFWLIETLHLRSNKTLEELKANTAAFRSHKVMGSNKTLEELKASDYFSKESDVCCSNKTLEELKAKNAYISFSGITPVPIRL